MSRWFIVGVVVSTLFVGGCAWWNGQGPEDLPRNDSQRMREQIKPDLQELEQVATPISPPPITERIPAARRVASQS